MPDSDEPRDDLSPVPEGSHEVAPEEWRPLPWSELIRRNPARVALVGGAAIVALILALVFVWGGTSSPPDSKALHSSLFSPLLEITVPTTVPPSKSTTTTAPPNAAQPAAQSSVAAGGKTTNSLPATTTAPASPPGPCTANDLTFTTTTDRSSYSPGSLVTVTTKLVDNVACVFTPVATGEYGCSTTIVIAEAASGAQVYPMLSQPEECASVTGGSLLPGATRTGTLAWNQQTTVSGKSGQAPSGQYRAIGVWSWSSGTNNPYGAVPESDPFAIG